MSILVNLLGSKPSLNLGEELRFCNGHHMRIRGGPGFILHIPALSLPVCVILLIISLTRGKDALLAVNTWGGPS